MDSSAALKVLWQNGYISYKLELVDNASNKVISTIKELKFTAVNLPSNKITSYSLNTSKVTTKTARVRITIRTNIDGLRSALVDEYGTVDIDALAKNELNEIVLNDQGIIKEYALEQNYPNPFNPTTTIHYQLPNAGHVTLKVYDMLGREVATLVDEVKETGSYTVMFNAENLSSGMYIARLTAQTEEGKSFVQTRKMLMIK